MPKMKNGRRMTKQKRNQLEAKTERYRAKTLKKYGNPGTPPSQQQIDADVRKHAETQKTLRTASRAGAVSSSIRERADIQSTGNVSNNNNTDALSKWNDLINQNGTGGSNQNLDTGSDQVDRG